MDDDSGYISDFLYENLTLSFDLGKATTVKGIERLKPEQVTVALNEALKSAGNKMRTNIRKNLRNHRTGNIGKMASSIKVTEPVGLSLEVYTDDPQAPFYEFGTGIVGKNSNVKNPMATEMGWVYDHKHHGDKGWIAPKDRFDPQVYKYPVGKKKKYYITRGMPPHNFFYDEVRRAEKAQTLLIEVRKKLREKLK